METKSKFEVKADAKLPVTKVDVKKPEIEVKKPDAEVKKPEIKAKIDIEGKKKKS